MIMRSTITCARAVPFATTILGASLLAQVATAAELPPIDFGAYVKLDVLFSRFSSGPVAQSTARDFFLPGATPVGPGGTGHSHEYLDFHAKETRLWADTRTVVGGYNVGAWVEIDFISGQLFQTEGSTTPDKKVANAYNPSLRRAFVTVDNWLFGQEWSNFETIGLLPEAADFVLVSDARVFNRQAQIRYRLGSFAFSLETPETWIYAHGANGATRTDDNTLPDFTARYDLHTGFGQFGLSAVARQLRVQNPASSNALAGGGAFGGTVITGANSSAFAYGLSFAGKIPMPWHSGDDIRFELNGGHGLGRYVGIATIADGALDATGKIRPINLYSGLVSYQHEWSPHWHSGLILSTLRGRDMVAAGAGTGATQRTQTGAVNLFYQPDAHLWFAWEYRYSKRTVVSGDNGSLNRGQFSVKYAF